MDGYVVGEVVSCDPVPNKDKLLVLIIDIGSEENVQVVTNAGNLKIGCRVVVATIGSKVRMGNEEVEVKKASVGGVPSQGMLCDGPMLGWSGGGAGAAALLSQSYAPGSLPPSTRPRMDGKITEDSPEYVAKPTGPGETQLFEKKLTKEEKKALREAKKVAKAST
mmetsp:Transcript_22528/g.31349  ORF Transcript_22528/g.31349 Transcript_22528/m.31349 type:complete len:165 (+) Transcript_22528:107-601(+)|eukprot:CAMPEP_0196579534 /NCGR_PEP_ID=MMETSP1081-20130531/22400_1 /TAXON_ID=36882 /ORGANISM="Pyramimonas amylifera, Strain CCMP720" /LENGTH=164 /DNA_ID=CAMNT_0041899157 /DNA_START=103 /DNA_END=600 /DNA_ORIENTATION=+